MEETSSPDGFFSGACVSNEKRPPFRCGQNRQAAGDSIEDCLHFVRTTSKICGISRIFSPDGFYGDNGVTNEKRPLLSGSSNANAACGGLLRRYCAWRNIFPRWILRRRWCDKRASGISIEDYPHFVRITSKICGMAAYFPQVGSAATMINQKETGHPNGCPVSFWCTIGDSNPGPAD